MLKLSLSLDGVQYNLKPVNEMGMINNRIADSAIYDVDLSYVADAVGNKGQSFCPAIFSGGRRKKTNYIKQQLFALDFDSGIPYEEIKMRSVYYGLPIAFSYFTFSSTPTHEKFRVVYLLECEVTDIRVAEAILAMLRKIFPESDKQCSDASHIYLGSRNSLIEYNDKYVFFTNILDAFYNSIKNSCPSNFPRTIRGFANKHHINLLDNNLLDIGVKNVAAATTIYNIYNNETVSDDKEFVLFGNYYIIFNSKSNGYASGKTLSLKDGGKKYTIKCRFAGIKYAPMYCRLYKEFIKGIDIGHDGRFHIMTVLLQIRGGKKIFLNTIRDTGYDYEKWYRAITNLCTDEYDHERSCDKCPYCDSCDHKRTLIETVSYKIKMENPNKIVVDHNNPDYISLDEGRVRLKENIYNAIKSVNLITLIKAQTGIGKTHAYREIVSETYENQRYIIALPNNMMKNEVAKDLKRMGIPDDVILVTPSHSEGRIDKELEEEIQLFYDRGIYDQTISIIKQYMKENDKKLTILEKCYLNSFLDFEQRLLDDKIKIIVTTHVRLCTFDDTIIKDSVVIIDEDILVSSFFLQTRQVSVESLEAIVESNSTSASAFFQEIISNEDGKVHNIINGAFEYFSLSKDQLDKMGVFENVNDLFRAASYVIENGIVTYYVPGKLPKGKCIILSATLDVEMYKKYFRLSDHDIRYIEDNLVRYKGKVIQFNALPIGRGKLDESETWSKILNTAQEYVAFDAPVITFKKYQNKENINSSLKPNIASGFYISKCLGSNGLKGRDIIIAGTPYMDDKSYELIGAYLTGRVLDPAKFRNRITYGGYEFFHFTYMDNTLQNLQCYWMKGELEQAVGRARIIQCDKTVVVFASVPCEQATYISRSYMFDDENTEDAA